MNTVKWEAIVKPIQGCHACVHIDDGFVLDSIHVSRDRTANQEREHAGDASYVNHHIARVYSLGNGLAVGTGPRFIRQQ